MTIDHLKKKYVQINHYVKIFNKKCDNLFAEIHQIMMSLAKGGG